MQSAHAGGDDPKEMTPLALPTNLGGHHGHIAAALTSSKQHLEQQKQLNAALQVDISSLGKRHASLLFCQFVVVLQYAMHLHVCAQQA